MTENEINRLTIKAINDELSDIWTLDKDSLQKECFILAGMVFLNERLINAFRSEPEEKEQPPRAGTLNG